MSQQILTIVQTFLGGAVFGYVLLLVLSIARREAVFNNLLKQDWLAGWLMAAGVVMTVIGIFLSGEAADFLLIAGGFLIMWGFLTALNDDQTVKVLRVTTLALALVLIGIGFLVYYWLIPTAIPAVISWVKSMITEMLKPGSENVSTNTLMSMIGLTMILIGILIRSLSRSWRRMVARRLAAKAAMSS